MAEKLDPDTWPGLVATTAVVAAVEAVVTGLIGAVFDFSASRLLLIAAVTFVGAAIMLIGGAWIIRRRDVRAALLDARNGLALNLIPIKENECASGYTGELWPSVHLQLKRIRRIEPIVTLIEQASQGVALYNAKQITADDAISRIKKACGAISDELGRKPFGPLRSGERQ